MENSQGTLAAAMRENMLRNLDVFPTLDRPDDPSVLFHHHYQNGGTQQLRTITRADGVTIPVFSTVIKQEKGGQQYRVELLSKDLVPETIAQLQEHVLETELDQRLQDEFRLDPQFTKLAQLTIEDKQSMLDSYDDIQSLETAEPDLNDLKKIRKKVVRATMPITDIGNERGIRKMPNLLDEYEQSLAQFIHQHELDPQQQYELLEHERLLRLESLNSRLKARKRLRKAKIAAITGTMTTVGVGGGALVDIMFNLPGIGTAVGGSSGLTIGIQEALRQRRRGKYIHGFSNMEPSNDLRRQLGDERKLASAYHRLTGPHG